MPALRTPRAVLTAAVLAGVSASLVTGPPAAAAPPDPTVSASVSTSTSTSTSTSAELSDDRPLRLARVTVTGRGFPAEERVEASLPSRNQGRLGTAVADDDGEVSIPFTVPLTLPAGIQEVRLTGTSGVQASTGFTLRPLAADLLLRLRPVRPPS